jgi:hypothetical protein
MSLKSCELYRCACEQVTLMILAVDAECRNEWPLLGNVFYVQHTLSTLLSELSLLLSSRDVALRRPQH